MADYAIDITKVKCPMTLVKVVLKLDQLEAGDVLHIYLLDGEPLENVPESLGERNFTILSQGPLPDGQCPEIHAFAETKNRSVYELVVKK